MVKFEWVPSTLDGVYPDGERWLLYVTGQTSPGYPKYLGRVVRSGKYYSSGTDEWFDTMRDAALDCQLAFGSELETK